MGGRASGGRFITGRKSASKASKAFGSGKAEEKHHVGFDEVDGRFSLPPGVGEFSATRRNLDNDLRTTSFEAVDKTTTLATVFRGTRLVSPRFVPALNILK